MRDSIRRRAHWTAAMDRELAGVQSALFALATSPSLASGDLRAFYGQAKEVLPKLIATQRTSHRRERSATDNTLRAFGEPLPAMLRVRSEHVRNRPAGHHGSVPPAGVRPALGRGRNSGAPGRCHRLRPDTAILPERLSVY